VLFAIDACDREVMAWLATFAGISGEMVRDLMVACVERRFGISKAAHPVEWLSDNGSAYIPPRCRWVPASGTTLEAQGRCGVERVLGDRRARSVGVAGFEPATPLVPNEALLPRPSAAVVPTCPPTSGG
jgi:hypothetical protein